MTRTQMTTAQMTRSQMTSIPTIAVAIATGHRPRRLAGMLMLSALLACAPFAGAVDVPKPDELMTDSVFAADSFWYSAIPKDVVLHENNAAFVADFLRQKKAYYGHVNINTKRWASPIYVVGPDVPVTRVTEWNCQKKPALDKGLGEQWAAVPMPDDAQQADGNDSEMTVYQPSTDTLWEFWQARKVDGKWQGCWGGRMQHVSKNNGVFPGHYGTTATSLPFIGGQITADELRRGEIRHAIGISLVDVEHFNIKSWPANRSDGWNPEKLPNRIPEGLRFRLDPGIDVDALKLSPAAKTIAKAAQTYGFVIWDKAGAISIRAQNPKSYPGGVDPYPELFDGKSSGAVLDGFPWDRLQFLPVDYGKPEVDPKSQPKPKSGA